MGLIALPLPADGTTADVADYNTPLTTLATLVNGNIDNANIASAAAIDGSKLADTSITNAKLITGAGQPGGAWTTYVLTLTNLSGGTQTFARYTQIGKTVHVRFKYVLAGAGVSGEITLTTPVTMSSEYLAEDYLNGQATFYDLSVTTGYTGVVRVNSTTAVTLRCIHTDGTRATNQATSSSNPISTWAAGDIITAHFTFEAA